MPSGSDAIGTCWTNAPVIPLRMVSRNVGFRLERNRKLPVGSNAIPSTKFPAVTVENVLLVVRAALTLYSVPLDPTYTRSPLDGWTAMPRPLPAGPNGPPVWAPVFSLSLTTPDPLSLFEYMLPFG